MSPGTVRPLVVGAGWAGLAAAVELAARGWRPRVLESADRPGGRARTLDLPEGPRETGQHLLLAGCREVLRLQRRVGLDPQRLFRRRPLRLQMNTDGRPLRLALPRLPAPFHLAVGLATARGLRPAERRAALGLARALRRPPPEDDLTVAAFLARHRQPPSLVERLWGPLCLAALNAPVDAASARLFIAVLRETLGRRGESDLLLQRTDLGRCLPEAAQAFIEARGGTVLYRHGVRRLRFEGGRAAGVETAHGTHSGQPVVLATPPTVTGRLLGPHAPLQTLAGRLGDLGSSPLTTVYLDYGEPVGLGTGLTGCTGMIAQWLFPRDDLAPGLVAAVVSGDGPHMELAPAALGERVAAELARRFPRWPAPRSHRTLRFRHGTFLAAPGVDRDRPDPGAAADAGLWLAGDYTATGLPATLEGAVRSGVQCARLIQERYARA